MSTPIESQVASAKVVIANELNAMKYFNKSKIHVSIHNVMKRKCEFSLGQFTKIGYETQ